MCGVVNLFGGIEAVGGLDTKIRVAIDNGFEQILVPKVCAANYDKRLKLQIEVIEVRTFYEALMHTLVDGLLILKALAEIEEKLKVATGEVAKFTKNLKPVTSTNLSDYSSVFTDAKKVKGVGIDWTATIASVEKLKDLLSTRLSRAAGTSPGLSVAQLDQILTTMQSLKSLDMDFTKFSKAFDGSSKSLQSLGASFVNYKNHVKKAQASVGAGGTGGGSGSGPGSSSSDQTTMIVSISVGAVVLLIILGIVIGIYLYLHHVHKLEQPVSKEDDKKPCSIAKSKDEMRTK
ncbi:WSN domain-containing protein [Caenorhabditis elegans]|uniref:WSN domain-containing protein n=1 Tax=Caenorhabditis elegans TaxID=6239 RepID=Q22948_CAEEL|nr:WSN domain-containing protein [Caenorhabditis elegans]CCD65598.2 WSN domain-containing protein [Caenorhabditis elegans]|eukprot:NP_001343629.1 Uncharacterized protein CELE_F08F3.8 [Caenorhabditis elegans]